MSDILVVAATKKECAFLIKDKKNLKVGAICKVDDSGIHNIDLLITGPGMVNTTYHLLKTILKKKYHLAVNIGVCGSLNPDFSPVKILNVTIDQFGDFGAENKSEFLDVFEMGLQKINEFPFKKSKLNSSFRKKLNCLNAISVAEGITVQKVTGSKPTINKLRHKYGNVVESMEGAAFMFVCLHENVPCLQIRAVSNFVQLRDKDQWKMKEAVNALSGFTGLLLMELETIDLS